MAQLVTETEIVPPSARSEPESSGPTLDGPLVLSMRPPAKMSDEQFIAFCEQNRDLRIERTAEGDLIIMPPAKGNTGIKNAEMNRQLANWAVQDETGRVFDSSGGFKLPNGAERSPDAAWVARDRLATLTPEEREQFIPRCPDFVVELRSPSDRLSTLKRKMEEYLANGARLGWLLDSRSRRVYIYRPGVPVEQLDDPTTLSGDPVLPGFVLDVARVFDATF